jgi:NitT/TauT family transport system substrate-binding protein
VISYIDIHHTQARHSRPVSGSGVNSSRNLEKHWIPGQARNDKMLESHIVVCRILFLFLLLFFLLESSLVHAEGTSLKKATFVPQWSPQAQFAGYYVAYEKGFYKRNGIDLTLLQGGPDHPASTLLVKREADFATLWLSTAMRMRANGQDIINIAQMVQRSALMLVAKRSSNIKTPQDMNGKKVSLWGEDFQIQPKAFFRRYNLEVKIVPQSFSVNLFLRDGVDVASAMWYNEYHTIINSGLNPDELTTFFFHEHGLNFPEDGIYTLEKTFKKDPSLACAFVKSSIEGWLYAFSHPEEALDIVLKYISQARIPANRVHQKWMLSRMKDLISPPDGSSIGILQPRDYERVEHELKENDLVKRTPSYSSFFARCDNRAEK